MHEYVTAGSYTVTLTVTNTKGSNTEIKVGYVVVGEADMSASRSFVPTQYTSPGIVDVTITITNEGADDITALTLEEVAPVGWIFEGVVSPNPPETVPDVGASEVLVFGWTAGLRNSQGQTRCECLCSLAPCREYRLSHRVCQTPLL